MSIREQVAVHPTAEVASGCPKCGREVETSDPACRACGLLRAHFTAFRLSSRKSGRVTYQTRWTLVEQNWTDAEAHEAFLAAAGREAALAAAAKWYRKAARKRRGDPMAARQLERISRMALAVHQVTAAPIPRERTTSRYRGLVMLFVILLLGGIGLARARGVGSAPRAASPGEIVSPHSPRFGTPVLAPAIAASRSARASTKGAP